MNDVPQTAPENDWRLNAVLFWTFLKIAAITVGGGYPIIAAVQAEFVSRRRVLTDDDFSDMMTVILTVPGLLAVNAAVYLGWKLRGLSGALAAVAGVLLPSVTVIMLIAAGLSQITDFLQEPWVQGAFRGILCGIIAMIGMTIAKMRKKSLTCLFDYIVAAVCFLGVAAFHLNPALLVLGAVVVGVIKVAILRKAVKK